MNEILNKVAENILNPFIILLFAIAALYFFWGLFIFLLNRDNESESTKGKRHIVYGLIGMVIMIGAFGIIQIIKGTFGIPEN